MLRGRVIIKAEDDKPLFVMGEVYVPFAIDTDGDTISKEELRKAAYDFMKSGRQLKIDVQHDLNESGCCAVQSFIARPGDPDFKEDSWVLGVEIYDEALKEDARKGELNGFSFYSDDLSAVTVTDLPVTRVRKLAGTTEPSTDPNISEHEHDLILELDEHSHVIPTFTSETNGHRHATTKTTATDEEAGHSHRLIY